jgi:hypothetical protein
MTPLPNRGGVGSILIAPPFPISIIALTIILLLGIQPIFAQTPSEIRTSITKAELEFHVNSTELTDLDLATSLAENVGIYFKDNDKEVLLVKIRTQQSERFQGDAEDIRTLQLVRSAVLKSLLLSDGGMEVDQIQIHLSIAYDNAPPMVTFEIHLRNGEAMVDGKGSHTATAGIGE